MGWSFDDFGGDVWEPDTDEAWRPDDLGGGQNTNFGSDDDYDFQGGTNPLTGLDVGSGEVGYGTSGGSTNWSALAKSLGLTNKDGDLDWSKLLGLGGAALALTGGNAAYNPRSAKDLAAMQPSNLPPGLTAAQITTATRPMQAGNQLTRQYAADMPSPIVPGKGYAEGGEIEGPLSMTSGFVQGPGDGQSDDVPINAATGEYVMPADVVSALGNGDNSAGADALDKMCQAIRARARSTANDQLPPPALGPLSYLKGGSV
jgi:hypothetical protein